MDLYTKSQQLLEALANSIHDNSELPTDFCFSIREIHVVERFLLELLEERRRSGQQGIIS